MYPGLTLTKHSGSWIGAHQRLNRIAYRVIAPEVKAKSFPALKQINYFEGTNGPDGLKRKSSGKHEPLHFYDPATDKGGVKAEITNHYNQLVIALKQRDGIRSAFEASWLAHAVTDGLTPAHHYPYVEKMNELLENSNHEVNRFKDKAIVHGNTKRETVKQTWKLVGSKGLISMHAHFEIGFSAVLLGKKITVRLDRLELERARKIGALGFFKEQARMVAELKMYERFYQKAWTVGLARQARNVLAPTIAQTVAIIWLLAYEEAGYQLKSSLLGRIG